MGLEITFTRSRAPPRRERGPRAFLTLTRAHTQSLTACHCYHLSTNPRSQLSWLLLQVGSVRLWLCILLWLPPRPRQSTQSSSQPATRPQALHRRGAKEASDPHRAVILAGSATAGPVPARSRLRTSGVPCLEPGPLGLSLSTIASFSWEQLSGTHGFVC